MNGNIGSLAVLAMALMAAFSLGTPQAAETRLERGAYLVRSIAACGNCHTPKDRDRRPISDKEFSGGVVFESSVFRAVSPNITPDNETGVGTWTDEQIVDSIRNGKRPDGTTIGPPMPIYSYRSISDTDVLAIVAYLRSVNPIRHAVEKSSFKIALPDTYGATVTHVADVPRGRGATYGEYLAGLGHCMECHTPVVKGHLDMARLGAGGRLLGGATTGAVSANHTPANPDGIAHWTDDQVKLVLTSGVRPDGRRLARMMAFDWYKHMDPDDLDALVAYLRTLPAAQP